MSYTVGCASLLVMQKSLEVAKEAHHDDTQAMQKHDGLKLTTTPPLILDVALMIEEGTKVTMQTMQVSCVGFTVV